MIDRWPIVSLGELAFPGRGSIAIGPFGSRMKAHNYTDAGVMVVRGQNITEDARIAGEFVYVSPEFAQRLGTARLRGGDLVFPHRGAIGRVGLVPNDGFIMSTSLMRIRLDLTRASPRFVAAYFTSDRGRSEILRYGSTVGTPGIGQPLSSLAQFQIPLPPLDEQRRIAGVLGAFADLIDTNHDLVARMEALLASVFEDEGFDSNSGDGLLGDVISVNPFYRKPTGVAPYVDMAALPTQGARVSVVASRKAAGGARFTLGDTLLARITPCLENGKTAFVDFLDSDDVGVGSTEFIVLSDTTRESQHWPYFLARSERFRSYAIRHMTGTSGRQRCPAEAVARYPLAAPDREDLRRFETLAAPLFAAMRQLDAESEELAHTRDELLPLLMSGRITVDEAWEAVS